MQLPSQVINLGWLVRHSECLTALTVYKTRRALLAEGQGFAHMINNVASETVLEWSKKGIFSHVAIIIIEEE